MGLPSTGALTSPGMALSITAFKLSPPPRLPGIPANLVVRLGRDGGHRSALQLVSGVGHTHEQDPPLGNT